MTFNLTPNSPLKDSTDFHILFEVELHDKSKIEDRCIVYAQSKHQAIDRAREEAKKKYSVMNFWIKDIA